MNRLFKTVIAALIVGAMMFMTGCSSISTEPDEVALHYSGGSFSSKSFKGCVDSSSREFDGPGDNHYVYPKGQRTFSFTGAEGSERGPINVTTGSQEVSVPGFVTFTLSTDCETLREFHEKVGNKYQAYKGGNDNRGWNDFLNDYVAVPLDSTLNKAAGAITLPEGVSQDQAWQALYTSADAQKEFESYVKENLPDEIEATLGSQYITVNAVSIAKPTVSDALKGALSQKEEARLENEAQKEKNAQVRTQFDTVKDCLNTGLDEQSCTLIFLSQSGADIPFLPVPQGGAVNFSSTN